MKTLSLMISTTALAAALASASIAQDSPTRQPSRKAQAATSLVTTFGPQFIRLWRTETDVVFNASGLPPEQRNTVAQDMISTYGGVRGKYARISQVAAWSSWGISAGAALHAVVSPPTGIPALLVASAGTAYFDAERERVAAEGIKEGRAVLAYYKPRILQDMGMSYDELRTGLRVGDKEIVGKFRQAVDQIDDLQNQVGGDPDLQAITADLMADIAANMDEAVIDQVLENTDDITANTRKLTNLSKVVHKLEESVDEQARQAEEAFEQLSGAVQDVRLAQQDQDRRLSEIEADQTVIADFVFNSMQPAEKLAALENGFLNERFSCAEGEESCAASEFRVATIRRLRSEVRLQSLATTATKAATTVSDIQAIAGNLGIDLPPEFGDAAKAVNAAAGAFTAFASGNPLGALAAVSSVFGKQRDPDAERFEILMGYLGQRFDRIDAKLDQIAQNQAELMNAVHSLSIQIEAGFNRVNDQLARLEFEQLRMGDGVRALIWNPWKDCNGVYVQAMKHEKGMPLHLDLNSMEFRSEASIRDLINVHNDLVRSCVNLLKAEMLAVGHPARFAKIIDLRWALDNSLKEENVPGMNAEQKEWRNRLMTYQSGLYSAANRRVKEFADNTLGGSDADAFAILSRPILSTDDWRMSLTAASEQPFSCSDFEHPLARLVNILCPLPGTAETDDARAVSLLEYPVLADAVLDIGRWALVVAPLADLRHGEQWVYPEDWLDRIEAGEMPPTESGGEVIVSGMVHALDIAIATYGQAYGPMPAAAALSQLKLLQDGGKASPAQAAGGISDAELALNALLAELQANPYVGRNLVQLMLEERFHAWDGVAYRPMLKPYTDAYQAAEKDQAGRYSYLNTMFGKDLVFAMNELNQLSLVLSSGSQKLAVPIPAPMAMAEGRLTMPSRYLELIAMRDHLADRLFAYQIMDDIPDEDQAAAALALLR